MKKLLVLGAVLVAFVGCNNQRVSKREIEQTIEDYARQPSFEKVKRDLEVPACVNSCLEQREVDSPLSIRQFRSYCECSCPQFMENAHRLGYRTDREVLAHFQEIAPPEMLKQCILFAMKN